jgi:hypothetical protein
MNKNNPTLEIKSVTFSWVQQDLYFIALKQSEHYSLCFGNPQVKKPEYDIANFVNHDTLSRNTYELAVLAPWHMSGGPRREWFSDIEKLILRFVVVILVVGMGIWFYTLMKKTSKK